MSNGSLGDYFFLHKFKVIVAVEADVALLVGLQIGNHLLRVAKFQHGSEQLAGNALALGILLDGEIIKIPIVVIGKLFFQVHGVAFVGEKSSYDAGAGVENETESAACEEGEGFAAGETDGKPNRKAVELLAVGINNCVLCHGFQRDLHYKSGSHGVIFAFGEPIMQGIVKVCVCGNLGQAVKIAFLNYIKSCVFNSPFSKGNFNFSNQFIHAFSLLYSLDFAVKSHLPLHNCGAVLIEGGGAFKFPIIYGHVGSDGGLINAFSEKWDFQPEYGYQKFRVVLYLGGKGIAGGVACVGRENGRRFIFAEIFSVFYVYFLVVAKCISGFFVQRSYEFWQPRCGIGGFIGNALLNYFSIMLRHLQCAVFGEGCNMAGIKFGNKICTFAFGGSKISLQGAVVTLSSSAYNAVYLSVQLHSVFVGGVGKTEGEYINIKGNEGNGHTGGIAVGRYAILGVMLLLAQLEQAIGAALTLVYGVYKPIVKKAAA